MDNLAYYPVTGKFSHTVLVRDSAATTISSTNRFDYAIKSKSYTKAALSTAATPTTDVVTGAAFVPVKTSQGSIFVLGLDSSGNIKVAQGQVVTLDSSGAFTNAPYWPAIPDTIAVIGYLVVKAGSTASASGWLFGTNNFTGVTGVTCTMVELMGGLPDRPQIS
jgi:hypothetical protein